MARKKAPPKRAPEYEKPKAKKKSPPGKAKDGSACFTRKTSAGGSYVTCKGTQGKSSAASSRAKARTPQKATKPKISRAEFNQARSNLTKTMARKPGTKPKAPRSVGSYADSTATKRSTRAPGEGGFAKRTGGAPGTRKGEVRKTARRAYEGLRQAPTSENKPKGMSMTEWREVRGPEAQARAASSSYIGPRQGQSEADAIHEFLGV